MPIKPKSRSVAIALASIPYTGWLGIDRFYLGRYITGVLKLLLSVFCMSAMFFVVYGESTPIRITMLPVVLVFSLGMFAWYIADIICTCSRNATDKWGRPLMRRPSQNYVQPGVYVTPVYMAPPPPPGTVAPMQEQAIPNNNPGAYPPPTEKR